MRARSTSRRAKQPSALCTEPSVGGSRSSDNTDYMQRNSDVFVNCTKFVGGPPDKTADSQVAF